MEVYFDEARGYRDARLHPYSAGDADQSGFIDFKAQPQRIPEVLEDFRPFADRPAIQTFYAMLAWINGPQSRLESCDCLLRPPAPHRDANSSRPLCINGRLCLMFRHLPANCDSQNADWLCGRMMAELSQIDVGLPASDAVVGFSQNASLYTAISQGFFLPDGRFDSAHDDPGMGTHPMLSVWAYGDDEDAAFDMLERVYRNIWQACRHVSTAIDEGLRQQAAAAGQ